MFLSDLSIKRPIMMSMLLIVFILFGAIGFIGMPLNLTPDIDIPYILIQTVYEGAGPKEVESQITKKIEDAISSVSKINMIVSYSMEGVSLVVVEFELDKDVDIASQEIKDKVDAILADFPDDADLPTVEKYNIQELPIVEVVLSGDLPLTELYDLADKHIKDRFSQIAGVARAEITGGQEREIQVVLDDRVIVENHLSVSDLAKILAANNLNLPAGHFEKSTREYTVRLNGEYESVQQLAETEIPTVRGMKRLSDIARISDTGEEVRKRASYFNNLENRRDPNLVTFSIVKNAEGNTVEIAEDIIEIIPEIENTLPAGCKLEVVSSKAPFIRDTYEGTLSTIIMGILLTGLVMFLFLHDIKSTIIVGLAMPMSIISAFLFMDYLGFTKNIMTLMGLSTSVGILVSNSIVVLENIFRRKERGDDSKTAAAKGTAQVVVAVIAATATNIAVFLPVANMSSLVGQMFKEFALTVTFATMFSLLISFTLTPMMASLILRDNGKTGKRKKKFSEKIEAMTAKMELAYKGLLSKLLNGKKRSVAVITVSVLILVAVFAMAGDIGFDFFPMLDEGDIRIEAEFPVGYSLNETAKAIEGIENILIQDKTIATILTKLGFVNDNNQGTNMAAMSIKLIDAGKRQLTTDETASKFIKELSAVSNVRLRIRAVSSMGGGEDRQPILFYVKGQDIDEVERLKGIIVKHIKDIPGLVNLNTSSRPGQPEISIIPDRKKISDAGLSVYEIAYQLRGALTGLVASQYRDLGEEYDIRVTIEDEVMDTPEKVANLTIFSGGRAFTISQLADVEFTEGYTKIMHVDKFKAIEISGATAPGVAMGDVINEINLRLAEIDMPSGYETSWAGISEMMQDTIMDMLITLILAIVLTYMLLAAILENLLQPLLVLGTFPLAMIGVILALLITGSNVNIIAMMSVIMLLGIVVNNAILILDNFNDRRKEGNISVKDAMIEACTVKLRPIIMSSIAIILGMMPMALGFGGAGKEVREPMGIVSIGGLVVSAILTLFIIPAIYNLLAGSQGENTPANAEEVVK